MVNQNRSIREHKRVDGRFDWMDEQCGNHITNQSPLLLLEKTRSKQSLENNTSAALLLLLLQSDHHLGGVQRSPLPGLVEDSPPPDAPLPVHSLVGSVQSIEVAVSAVLKPERKAG